jgi:hypothetical protein
MNEERDHEAGELLLRVASLARRLQRNGVKGPLRKAFADIAEERGVRADTIERQFWEAKRRANGRRATSLLSPTLYLRRTLIRK